MLALAVSVASSHAIWIERHGDGYAARFGEIQEGVADTLRADQGWERVRLSCASGGAAPTGERAFDRLEISGGCASPLLVHDGMAVHGAGSEAGRGVFVARYASESGPPTPVLPALGLDLLPIAGSGSRARLLRRGEPVPGGAATAHGPSGVAVDLVADSTGVVALPEGASGTWILSAWIESAEAGAHRGAAFAKVWYVATLAMEAR